MLWLPATMFTTLHELAELLMVYCLYSPVKSAGVCRLNALRRIGLQKLGLPTPLREPTARVASMPEAERMGH